MSVAVPLSRYRSFAARHGELRGGGLGYVAGAAIQVRASLDFKRSRLAGGALVLWRTG
jgi:hypothetical protein